MPAEAEALLRCVVRMETLGFDPDTPNDRETWERIRGRAGIAREIPPEVISALVPVVAALNVIEEEALDGELLPPETKERMELFTRALWVQSGQLIGMFTGAESVFTDGAESVPSAQEVDLGSVAMAVGHARVTLDEAKAEAKRHPAYLARLAVERETQYRRFRVVDRLCYVAPEVRHERDREPRRPSVRRGPRKSRAPDDPHGPDDDVALPRRARGLWSFCIAYGRRA
jgi:hypothetical protein